MGEYENRSKTTLDAAANANIHVVGKSIIGTRAYQQDAYYIGFNGNTCMTAICDGMGGSEHGEIASKMTIEMIAQDYENMQMEEDPYQFLREEAIRADETVSGLKDENGYTLDSGTTLIAAIVKNHKIWWMSIGDSRIYLIRKSQLCAVTKEHNYRFQLDCELRNHEITEEEYSEEIAQGDALISYVGMNGIELIDQNAKPFEMQYLDKFLLCSDGLIKALGEDTVKEILLKHPLDIQGALEELIKSTETCGKKHIDNTTVVLISYE
ncbi:MAG: serine/threonine-protein phosphatase [Acetatifactor sp.]|nr:serine/threonine-protein phosphatase [Acetatifactor sp.]